VFRMVKLVDDVRLRPAEPACEFEEL
jgi:hypothetical protein